MRNYIVVLFTLLLVIYSCANIGVPSGGPSDEDPPVVKKSVPVNGAMNFKKEEVIIEFDEIIVLDEVSQKLVVSPPMRTKPKVQSRSNKLFIGFEEELQDNTTYTLDFSNSIKDNNEGNPIPSFVFSFSTGSVVDSFAIMGHLWDSFDLSPIKSALVMAHKNLNDTAFVKDVPVRIGKTDEEGHFAIHNLSPGKYRIYAIKDANSNYMYDQPGEDIAWLDTIVSPAMSYVAMPDTLENDSVVFHDELVYTPNDIKLFMFEEESIQQYFMGEERADSNIVSFMFKLAAEQFSIKPLNIDFNEDWAVYEPSVNNDTIKVWLTDSLMYSKDTLDFAISYLGLDTLKQPVLVNDTLKMYYFKMPKKQSRRSKKKEGPEPEKTLQMAQAPAAVDVNKSFNFVMPTPVKRIDKNKLALYEFVDTLMHKVDFSFRQDTLLKRKYSIEPKRWTPGGKYLFVADSAAIEDVYGLECDSIGKQFSVKALDSYGTLLIKLINPQENWLVQLLGSKDQVIDQKHVPASGKFGFQYIKPGKYTLKLILDNNKNGKWDTGEYASKRQPEQVFFYPDYVEVKANWQIAVPWDLEEFDIYDFVSKNRKAKTDDD